MHVLPRAIYKRKRRKLYHSYEHVLERGQKWRAIWSYGSMLQPVTEETFLDVFVGGGGRDVGRLYLHRQI